MQHSFNVDMAKIYGIEVAIFLNNIAYWVNFNKNEGNNFYEGRYWTFNKIKSFPEHFPYWGHKQVERILNKCVSEGLLIKGCFNKLKYDRTCWYSLSDLSEEILNINISRNREMEIPKSVHGNPEIGTTIPNNKPYNKTQIKDKDKTQPKKQVACEPYIDPYVLKPIIEIPEWLNKDLWEEFKQHRKTMKKPMSELSQKKTINQLEKMKKNGEDVEAVINQSIANGWQGIFPNKSHGGVYGKVGQTVGKSGYIEAPRNWATEQWAILKEGCGLSRDADLSKIKGLVPGEVWDDLPDPRRDYDGRPSLEYNIERDI